MVGPGTEAFGEAGPPMGAGVVVDAAPLLLFAVVVREPSEKT